MSAALLSVQGLAVHFRALRALEEVSFEMRAGETVAVVGESGAGKSTLARALLRLVPIERGTICFAGVDLARVHGRPLRALRRDLQIVFQDPLSSLDPRMTVGETLGEPLALFEPRATRAQRAARIAESLERVALAASLAACYPRELSGGQCQRVAIARAMMSSPRLLVCDEPVSALDVSIQGQIVNLLADLQDTRGTSILLISHNLAVVRHLAHRVIVLLEGRVLETGSSERVLDAPAHPYTRALMAAVPTLRPRAAALPQADEPGRTPLRMPARRVAGSPAACVYAPRCPHLRALCERSVPPLEPVAAGHAVACHRWREI